MFNIEFLSQKKTVVCSLEGNINSEELSAAVFTLVNDKRYTEEYHCIWDLRNVPDFANFQAESKTYAKIFGAFRKSRRGKLVIIAHNAKSSPAFVKFYGEMIQEKVQLELHKNLELALIWLDSQN